MIFFADAPTELLVEIFDSVHQAELYSDTRSSVPAPLALSHVCCRWRSVILGLPQHWTHVHISHTRHPSVSRDVLQRSQRSGLSLSLALTNSTNSIQTLSSSKVFLDVMTDPSVTSRLRDLRIIGRNFTITRVAANFSDFPALENLIIRQVQPVDDHHYVGPFTFNPKVFKSLTLEGIGMHPSRSSVLSGIRALTLVRAAESILDQTALLDYNPPGTPPTPCLVQLSELRLMGTPPPSSNQRLAQALGTYSPSFDNKTLKYVYLSDYQLDIPFRIIRSSLNPMGLEELELANIRGPALRDLIGVFNDIAGTPLPFARLHTLTIRNSPFTHLLASYLLRPFPHLRILRLQDVDTESFTATLRDAWICPLVSSLLVDGAEVPRPPAIMMIGPPSG